MTTRNSAGVNSSFNRETASHRIANITENSVPKSVSYDTRGNVTFDALSNWTTNEFNRNNLPLTMANDTMSYSFRYNDNGERTNKNFSNGTVEQNEYYLNDYLGRTLAIYEDGRIREGIINGNGLVSIISVTDSNTNYYYFLKDHLGNIRTTLDANGAIRAARDFGPYGESLREYTSEGTVDRYQYTEKERDKESEDTYFGARYLSGYIPFWKSVDPLAEKNNGWSPYNYVKCDPLSRIDPNGLDDYYYDTKGNLVEKVEKGWFYNLFHSDKYFMQGSNNAPYVHDNRNYWEIESAIPENLAGKMEGVMESFEKQLAEFVGQNAAEGIFPFNLGEVLQKSPEGKQWDLKNRPTFPSNKFYLINGIGFKNDYAGNVAWAIIMKNSGWPLPVSIIGAGMNQTFMQNNPTVVEKIKMWLLHPFTFGDDLRDTRAIIHGYLKRQHK